MWGEIFSAGAGLLSSMFGGKKKQTTETTIDLAKLVKSANNNGFNPLTVLRNGGAAGFSTTTSPTISNTPEAFANLGGILGQALGDKLDPIQAKKRELDTLLVDTQLRQLKEGPQMAGRLYAPRTYTGTKVSQQLVPRLGVSTSSKTASVPAAYNPNKYEVTEATKVNYGNQSIWQSNPWLPSADTIEQDFGDVAGSAYGVPKLAADLAWNGWRFKNHIVDSYRKSAAFERRQSKQIYVPPKRLGGWAGRSPKVISGGGGGW
ncbi:hypothetical protein [Agrobacterium larrymoorei]|uniref:DNA pilot protein n=1 Tax=Agrobacterium larrymoorei TaxID=160699 RepID=A0AAF0H8P3_9HYPH|nr:hypothetical protein [Agrobacterium larrymoorei]WHA39890.1 hypothetical protein CFBP5477_008480 [Agrobacterium larrymoorei]